jgi:hypothetical protein
MALLICGLAMFAVMIAVWTTSRMWRLDSRQMVPGEVV